MVAGDEIAAVPGLEIGERLGRAAQVGDGTVDEVPDDGHQVGSGGVDRVDDAPGVCAAQDRTEVDVADHGDTEAVGPRGSPASGTVTRLTRGPRSTP